MSDEVSRRIESTGVWRATNKIKETSIKVCDVCKVWL